MEVGDCVSDFRVSGRLPAAIKMMVGIQLFFSLKTVRPIKEMLASSEHGMSFKKGFDQILETHQK